MQDVKLNNLELFFDCVDESNNFLYEVFRKPYFELIMGESTIPHIKRRLNAFELVADRYSIEPKEWEHKKEQMKKKILFLNECCVPYEIHEATEVLKDEIALEMKSLLK